jgi:hypothetical protein
MKAATTHFRNALILQVDQHWAPCTSRKNNLVSIVLRSVNCLDTDTDTLCKKWLFEGACTAHVVKRRLCLQHVNVDVPAKPKFDSSIPQILAYSIDGFRCSKPATISTKDSLPPLDLISL